MTEALELQPDVSDGDLARAAAGGDPQAFAEIYDRYADRLYDFCVGLIGDRDAAADCVQDAFCVAATDLGGLREPDKLRPWLYSITRHHAMRRLRHRYREEVSDELPEMVSHEASPETLAGQSDLARLVAEAAGGLSDRDRELLDLSYRHGLDGPELAEALGVTLTSANTMMFRLRQTVERCLGALLVARGARANPHACPELTAILKGWDGQFTVLMRKRMARHIDSCQACEQDQRRQVNPVALLGAAPVFIPAPSWLRRQTLDRVQLTCASSTMTDSSDPAEGSGETATSSTSPGGSRHAGQRRRAVAIGVPLLCLILSIAWFVRPEDPVSRVVETGTDSSRGTDSSGGPPPAVPVAKPGPRTTGHPQLLPPDTPARPPVPTNRGEPIPGGSNRGPAPAASNPGPTPAILLPSPGPVLAPPAARIDSATGTNSDRQVTNPGVEVGPAPVDIAPVDAAPVDTAPVENPKDTTAKPPGTTGTLQIPNLDPKVISSYPQNKTATVTNPNATSPNLQVSTAPKPNTTTNGGTAPKPNTNTNTNTNAGTAPNTNTNTNTNAGTAPKPNTNTNTNSKSSGQTSK